MEDKCSNFECKLHEDKCKYIKEHTKSLNCELKQFLADNYDRIKEDVQLKKMENCDNETYCEVDDCNIMEGFIKTITLSCNEKRNLFNEYKYGLGDMTIEPQKSTTS